MKKKCKSKVPMFEDGTQVPKQQTPPPCPCELDANGDCPCDPNKPIIEGATANISGLLLSLKGNLLFPNPLLTIIVVFPFLYEPLVYFGNTPCFGAYSPPIKGALNCPP